MLIKNFFRIIKDHKFFLIPIILHELIYFLKGYKGFKFNFSNNNEMSDNIPCPYYFLIKIKKKLNEKNFTKFIDLGCGSGRVIDFFHKNFENKKFLGIEYFDKQYKFCKNNFINQKNIEIIQSNFIDEDVFKYDAACYFLNAPFKKSENFLNFIKTMQNYHVKKNFLVITVNIDKKTLDKIKNVEFIESFFIGNNKGYSIFSLSSN